MTIDIFTKCLSMITLVMRSFPPLMWVLSCAILCSIAFIIKNIVWCK